MIRQGAGKRNTGIRKFMGDAVFAHCNFNFHSGIVNFAKNLLDPADGLTIQSRRFCQLNNHDLTGLGQTCSRSGNQDVLTISFVFWHNDPDAAFLQQAANDGLFGSLNNFGNAPFWAPFTVTSHNPNFDAVFVQYRTHLVRGQIDVRLAVITGYKSMAIAMALNYSLNFIQQATGLANIFDTMTLFPEMPRWRNW